MITIYTIPNCDGCRHAIALCELKRIDYEVKELRCESDIAELHDRLGGNRNIRVPLAIDGELYIGHLPELKKYIDTFMYK